MKAQEIASTRGEQLRSQVINKMAVKELEWKSCRLFSFFSLFVSGSSLEHVA